MLLNFKKFFLSLNLYLFLFSLWTIKQIDYSIENFFIYKNLNIVLIVAFVFFFIFIILAFLNLINKKKFIQYSLIIFLSLSFSNLLIDLFKKNIERKKSKIFYENLFKKFDNYKFDLRTQKQVVDDLKKETNSEVYPVTHPKHNLKKLSNFFPLSGISNSTIVFCNESGNFSTYKSDRYGFNNYDENYDNFNNRVILIGDSFAHGACVDQNSTLSAQLNKINIPAFSFAYGGNGPLLELATLIEYIDVKTEIVLWIYAENDMFDLIDEKKSEVLMNYLKKENYDQNLINRQNEIDSYWKKLLKDEFNLEDTVLYKKKKNSFDKILRYIERSFLLKPSRDMIKNYYKNNFINYNSERIDANLGLFKNIINKARNVSNKNGAEFYFVYISFLENAKQKKLISKDKIIKVVNGLNIKIIDFHSYLSNEVERPEIFYPFERSGHYNDIGYKTLADFISRQIN